jgi:hypothetical protein
MISTPSLSQMANCSRHAEDARRTPPAGLIRASRGTVDVVRRGDGGGSGGSVFHRFLRWQASSYWQVWSFTAAVGLICFIFWAFAGRWVWGLGFGSLLCLFPGIGWSYKLELAR